MRKNQILINEHSDQNILVGTLKSKAGDAVKKATVRLDFCDYGTTPWTPGTEKSEGDKVIATSDNNHEYGCIGEGETGIHEPNWPLSGGTVPDGDLFWVDLGVYDSSSLLEHVRFYYHCLPNEVDDGHYAFEVNDKVLVASEGTSNFIVGFEDLKPKSCIVPHFFVKVKEGDNFKYYWLFFLNADEEYEITIKEVIMSPQILEKMSETPYNHPHKATKAFTMNVGNGDERWVAASHMLTKNRVEQFLPLHYPSGLTDPPSELPLYPTPSFYPAPTLINTGLNHPCPPCRFYCNPEDGIMAWYSGNPTIVETQNFICGIVYDVKEQRIKKFIHYPSDVAAMGYAPYWAVDVVETELPTPLMFDVQSLTTEELNVAIAWSKRPINCKTNLITSGRTYSEITTCTHVRWSGEDTGFEHELFATFEQELSDLDPVLESDSLGPLILDCSVHLTYPECIADEMHEMEVQASRSSSIYRNYDFGSVQTWDLLGNVLSVIADDKDMAETLNCFEKQERCAWPQGVCINQDWAYGKGKDVAFIVEQQLVETWSARWVCPNSLDLITNKHKVYCVSTSEIRIDSGFPSAHTPSADDMDNLLDGWWSPYKDGYLHTVGDSFYQNLVMAGDDWPQIDYDNISGYELFKWKWERSTNVDTNSTDTLHRFQVDENLEFSYDDVDNIYYLDDRSTEKSQGVVAAGRGIDIVGEDFTPIYWKIYWAKTSTNYSDVTSDILTALGIEQGDLYEVGLI
jgi:hypothetical protein